MRLNSPNSLATAAKTLDRRIRLRTLKQKLRNQRKQQRRKKAAFLQSEADRQRRSRISDSSKSSQSGTSSVHSSPISKLRSRSFEMSYLEPRLFEKLSASDTQSSETPSPSSR